MASHPAAGNIRRPGPRRVDLRQLAAIFLKRGNLTFGSAAALASLLRDDLVARRGWMDDATYALIYTLARVTPGTNMMALYAGLGWALNRWSGTLIALLAASIPPSIIVVLLTLVYEWAQGSHLGRAAAAGAVAGVVGIIVGGAWMLVQPAIRPGNGTRIVLLVAGSIALSEWTSLGPLTILFLAAALGWLWPEDHP